MSLYPWPTDLLLAREVAVSGSGPLSATSHESVRQYERGLATPVGEGLWFDGVDESGDRKLGLHPTPGAVGAIDLEYVYRPAALVNDSDEPSWMPAPFHKGLPYSALAVYFETVEDNPELAKWNQEKADAVASELRSYDIERGSGNGVFAAPVVGWTTAR